MRPTEWAKEGNDMDVKGGPLEWLWLSTNTTWIVIAWCGIISLFWERLQAVVFSKLVTTVMLSSMLAALALGLAARGARAHDLLTLGVMLPLAIVWLGACAGRRASRPER